MFKEVFLSLLVVCMLSIVSAQQNADYNNKAIVKRQIESTTTLRPILISKNLIVISFIVNICIIKEDARPVRKEEDAEEEFEKQLL